VSEGTLPVDWSGRQATVTLPEHIDAANADQVREDLLTVINRGAAVLTADMTATVSCDYGGADALVRAYQRGAVSGTQLRLVVTAPVVRRILEVNGLDRLISIYPDLESATAAGSPAMVLPLAPRPDRSAGHGPARSRGAGPARRPREAADQDWPGAAALTPAVLWNLVDALSDGVLLADDDGTIMLVNRRLEEMFGYRRGELAGQSVESLIPAGLRPAHAGYRAGYARERTARRMASRARLVGLRRDGATLPVEISLSPVRTRTGYFTLAVVRDATDTQQRQDLAELARAVAAGEQEQKTTELLDRIVNSLLHVGLSLESAIDLPHDLARQRITDAVLRLDNTIHEIRDHVFAAHSRPGQPRPAPPDGPGGAAGPGPAGKPR
jgi:anti-anti-sigma factor